MADKKLNELTTASDGAYVYAEDASGNQIKISKADLASVVAGIFKTNQTYPFISGNTVTPANFDAIDKAGQYWVNGSSQTDILDWAALIVYNCGGSIIQVKFNLNRNNIVWRKKNSFSADWGNWNLITSTSLS